MLKSGASMAVLHLTLSSCGGPFRTSRSS